MNQPGPCYSCGAPTERACARCARPFCPRHGEERTVPELVGRVLTHALCGLCEGCAAEHRGGQRSEAAAVAVVIVLACLGVLAYVVYLVCLS